MLSWQLPEIASTLDVDLDVYFINYTWIGTGMFTTRTSNTPTAAIGGLESGRTYMFRVFANFSRPILQSGERTLQLTTQRELEIYSVGIVREG